MSKLHTYMYLCMMFFANKTESNGITLKTRPCE